MPDLNDTQRVLLSHAAQQPNASLYPLPASHANGGTRITRAITALGKLGLTEKRETDDAGAIHRADGDLRYGLFVTTAGLAAIGVSDGDECEPAAASAGHAPPPTSKSGSACSFVAGDVR